MKRRNIVSKESLTHKAGQSSLSLPFPSLGRAKLLLKILKCCWIAQQGSWLGPPVRTGCRTWCGRRRNLSIRL